MKNFFSTAGLLLLAAALILGVLYIAPRMQPATETSLTAVPAGQSGQLSKTECLQLGAAAVNSSRCRELLGLNAPAGVDSIGRTTVGQQNDPTQASQGTSCGQARDLGPWAPDVNWNGHNFEVTASDQSGNAGSSGVVLGAWWPHGKTAWGNKEITTFIPRGLSIEVQNGAGRGWDYEPGCAQSLIQEEMRAHMSQRQKDTNYHDYVAIDDLIAKGLVKVRFDRRSGVKVDPTPAGAAPAKQNAGSLTQATPIPQGPVCVGVRADRDPVLNVAHQFNPGAKWVIVNGWSNQTSTDQAEFKLLLSPNDNPAMYVGGAYWTYPAGCEAVARKEFAENKKPERSIATLTQQGYVVK